jgi:hypothetical protein
MATAGLATVVFMIVADVCLHADAGIEQLTQAANQKHFCVPGIK